MDALFFRMMSMGLRLVALRAAGVPLESAMKQEAKVSMKGLENWFHILTQLSDCLMYLHVHNKQIIHNDIKMIM